MALTPGVTRPAATAASICAWMLSVAPGSGSWDQRTSTARRAAGSCCHSRRVAGSVRHQGSKPGSPGMASRVPLTGSAATCGRSSSVGIAHS